MIAYSDSSGQTIIRQALETKRFDRFIGTDGMAGEKLIKKIGVKRTKKLFLFKTYVKQKLC